MTILQVLHQTVWRSLPAKSRRTVFSHLTRVVAPRPSPNARPSVPIIVVGPLSTASGIGQSARLTLRALAAAGIAHAAIDVSLELMQPIDTVFPACDRTLLMGPGVLLLNLSANVVPLVLARLGRAVVKDKWIVGYWAWELPVLPEPWREAVPFVNEIWTPSRFVGTVMLPHAAGRAVRVVPHPVAVQPLPAAWPRRRAGDAPFSVLAVMNVASGFTRKNPLGVIAAFREAFGGDAGVRLLLKLSHCDAYGPARGLIGQAIAGAPNIQIEDAVLERNGLDHLFAAADAVLSLHRSEGFGLVIAEAMLRGIPVVATDWSGNTDFLTSQNGIPVPFSMTAVTDPQHYYEPNGAQWAEPDLAAAARALRALRDDSCLCYRLGGRARRDAETLFGSEIFGRTVEYCLSGKSVVEQIPCEHDAGRA